MSRGINLGFGQSPRTLNAATGIFTAPVTQTQFATTASPPLAQTGPVNWYPGYYGIISQYGGTSSGSIANTLQYVEQWLSSPSTGICLQNEWGDLDNGSSIDNTLADAQGGTGNYAGMTTWIGNMISLIWAKRPGTPIGFWVNTIELWNSPVQNISTCSIPNYVLNCGGTLSVPDSFGSASSTSYTLPVNPSPGNQCGVLWYGLSGSNYAFIMAAYAALGVQKAFGNFWQAFASYLVPVGSAYNAGTTYVAGNLATSGGQTYCSIVDSNTGQSLANTAYWIPYANPNGGQSLGACNLIALIGNADEPSAAFANAANNSSSPFSYQQWWAGYNAVAASVRAAFPLVPFSQCLSYNIQGTDGSNQPNSYYTSQMTTMNAMGGVGLGSADVYPGDWWTGGGGYGPFANAAKLSYRGLNPSITYTGQAFGSYSTDYAKQMVCALEVQPSDYGPHKPAPPADLPYYSANVMSGICQAINTCGGHFGVFSMQDSTFTGTPWPTYMQPALTGTIGQTYPVNPLMPVNFMPGGAIVSVTVSAAAQLTVVWTAISGVGPGMTYTLFRNGVARQTGIALTTTSFVDSTLPNGTYTYTLALSNANGTGAQGPGVSATLGAGYDGTLQISGKNFINGGGNTIQLRGINCFGLETSSVHQNSTVWGDVGGPPPWSVIATWKPNIIRIPLNSATVQSLNCLPVNGAGNGWTTTTPQNANPYNIIPQLDLAIASAQAIGCYVILDLHWSAPKMTFGGVTAYCLPLWQMPCPNTDTDLTFWQFIANRYGTQATGQVTSAGKINNAGVLFELMNEPYQPYYSPASILLTGGALTVFHPNGNPNSITTNWTALGYQAIVNAIRAIGAQNVLIVNGGSFAQNLQYYGQWWPTDTLGQIAAGCHPYPSGTYPYSDGDVYGLTGFDAGEGTSSWDQWMIAIQNVGIPVIETEDGGQGGTSCNTSGEPHISYMNTNADANGFSRLCWSWGPTQPNPTTLINNQLTWGTYANPTPMPGEGLVYYTWLSTHP